MSAKDAIKNFAERLVRHFDRLKETGQISNEQWSAVCLSVRLQAQDEIERYEVIPKDASPLAKTLLEELQAL